MRSEQNTADTKCTRNRDERSGIYIATAYCGLASPMKHVHIYYIVYVQHIYRTSVRLVVASWGVTR